MFGYSKKTFECLIHCIENDVAIVEVMDDDENMSEMEIPKDDLISVKINFKEGNIFSFVLKQFCGWEKLTFIPIKRKKITQKKLNKMIKYYEEKYKDV